MEPVRAHEQHETTNAIKTPKKKKGLIQSWNRFFGFSPKEKIETSVEKIEFDFSGFETLDKHGGHIKKIAIASVILGRDSEDEAYEKNTSEMIPHAQSVSETYSTSSSVRTTTPSNPHSESEDY